MHDLKKMEELDTNSAAYSGLPRPFLEAMRKLFEILDKEGTGYIDLEGWNLNLRSNRISSKIFFLDIAERWQPQNNPNVPRNVIENLKKVTTKEGRLNFERFCAGLKISILRHEAEKNRVVSSSNTSRTTNEAKNSKASPFTQTQF